MPEVEDTINTRLFQVSLSVLTETDLLAEIKVDFFYSYYDKLKIDIYNRWTI